MTPNRSLSSLRMTRSLLVLIFAFCGLTAKNTIQAQNVRDNFLVDKIYDQNNILLAEYFYDNDNRLVKKIVSDNPGVYRRWIDEFEYENGRVSKIIHDDQTYSFDYDIHLFYNTEGQLNRGETYMNGSIVGHSNFHYENGRFVSVYNDNIEPFELDTIFYDNDGNVIKHTHIYPKMNDGGQPIPGEFEVREYHYEYDNNPKPNFGIDDIFIYDPLPYKEQAEFERGLSINNMTRTINEQQTWFYTYNENGLPATIQLKLDYLQDPSPTILRITYKQIGETSISEVTTAKINLYPNPVKDVFWIESGGFSTITLYDMLGKEVLNKNINGKSEINISHLPRGIYNFIVLFEDKIVANSKIVKQ